MRNFILAFQHVLAMFGATVLVPLLTGLNPGVALFTAGVGTLIFHLITGGKVPVFLGSSFAFIAGILAVKAIPGLGIAHATGAFMGVGVVYILMAALVYFVGPDKVKKVFPPIVTGPIIIVIGLILAPVAVGMAADHWAVAIITMAAVILTGIVAKGFFRFIPIITGVIVGYLAAMAFGLVDMTLVAEAAWLRLPEFMAPKFSLQAFSIIVPIALVTMIEHIGDITTNGAVVGKNFFDEPGLHRTLLGDGIATAFAGILGGPANTTYGENTGVLAVTKNYNPHILELAAVIALLLSFVGKFGALIQTIPPAVMGGVSFILFGMIASIGVKTLVDSGPDLSNLRNSSVVFIILITGIMGILGENNPLIINITTQASFSGLSLAAALGIVLNLVIGLLPIREAEADPIHETAGTQVPVPAKKINEN
ncbi:NCS2 family nucleobase:cation symporter [Metallumcola ferriviriculae]|uniref:NCS2 family nucleobase:cation symporter n=1 Tax=Metallumcola ferriviriculae TaxID=3039180 RepID=A0AAU0ULR7_9FIRM|nr:NCS2 family nucleobase:cation symporter [Desulfitibacteraceae bacterium MK1]